MTDLPVDPGLLVRFRAAGGKIAWRPVAVGAPVRPKPPIVQVAHLHDEEARIERRESAGGSSITVDSGPVGALVLLLEIDQRGPPASLSSVDAKERVEFPNGAIAAEWERASVVRPQLPLSDLVALARYALR